MQFNMINLAVILGAVGLVIFMLFKFGVFKQHTQFKGRQEVQQIVFTESEEKVKMLGIIPIKKTMLYRDVLPIGQVYKVMQIPYSVITKEKYTDEETGEEKYKKNVNSGKMFMFEIRKGLFAFLGLGKSLFFVNEKFVNHLSDGYKIAENVELERWGNNFWYSKDIVTTSQVENIVWKSNYVDILGLVKDFPEKVITFDPSTAKQVKQTQEDYQGQKELKQGRIVKD